MTRRDRLLRDAIGWLEDMRDPFDHAFLVEHSVTLNECGDLSDDLALGARMVLQTRDQIGPGLAGTVAAQRIVDALMLDVPRPSDAQA